MVRRRKTAVEEVEPDTEEKRRAVDETQGIGTPKQGETYRCEQCGMELEVIVSCGCADADSPHFQCCGEELVRV